jgi:hypothetical protein
MRLNLTVEERAVLKCLKEEEYPLLATTIADKTGLENYEVMDAFASLAEKELFIAVDRTAGELSPFGRNYNLFDDEGIDELSGKIRPETEILLRHFLENPDATPSFRELEAVDGMKPEEIERAIEELETWKYPARSRVKP